jgi:cytochrome c553
MENKTKKLSLLQILLIAAGILWFGVLAGTVYIMPDIPKTPKEDIRRVIYKDTLTVPDLEFSEGKMIPGVKIADVLAPNEKLLTKGAELFKSSCASCHGDLGKGDGVGGANLNPLPRNFHKKAGWKNGREINGIYKTIQEGIPGSGMTAYEFLPVEDKFSLIYYIRTFGTDFPDITEADIIMIDQSYDITSDRKGGASIPVKVAKEKVIKDKKSEVDVVIQKIDNSTDATHELFNNITVCKKRAVQTLISNQDWKNDVQLFTKIVTSNTKVNGFKAAIDRLNSTQIAELHNFLKLQF